MTRTQEFEQRYSGMNIEDREAALLALYRVTVGAEPGIVSIPGVCGGDPCVVRTRIPVWLLESLRRQGATDQELIAAYPSLTLPDLLNAWVFVAAHRDEIDRQIAEEDAG